MAIGLKTNTELAVCANLFCNNALVLIYLGGVVHNFIGQIFDKMLFWYPKIYFDEIKHTLKVLQQSFL